MACRHTISKGEKEIMTKLTVTVRERDNRWSGSYQLTNSSPASLQTKDGQRTFGSRASLNTSAKGLATSLGAELEMVQPTKQAAKKSVKSKTSPKKSSKPAKKSKN